MTDPLVSVVTPLYNSATTVGATLSGVLTQTHPRVECIVVDDGSTDGSEDICRGYGDRITHVRTPNRGSSAARNTAMELSTGEFIAFCDSDDVLLPPYLAAALDTYRAAGGGRRIVMNDALLLSTNGVAHGRRLINRSYPAPKQQRLAILQKNFVPILSVFPRALYEEIGGFDEDLDFTEDWEFWIRAVLAGWEVVYQSTPHALYRLSPNSKTTDARQPQTENDIMRTVRERYAGSLSEEEIAFLDLRATTEPPRHIDRLAGQALREGRYAEARAGYRQLALLSSTDPRVRARSEILSRVPGAAHLWRQYLRRIDARLGGRSADQTMEHVQEETP